MLCSGSNTDDDDDYNDDDYNVDGIIGKRFSLDDVFNDTFNPKLFSAEWINGTQLYVCLSVCLYLLLYTHVYM